MAIRFKTEYLEESRKHYFGRYFIDTLYSFLKPEKYRKILDVGCGSGFFTRLIAEHTKADVTGADRDEEVLKVARRLAREKGLDIKFSKQDARNLDYKDNSFDLVWCQMLLCNIDNPEQALREMKRVSKGTVAAVEPCNSTQILYVEDEDYKEFFRLMQKAMGGLARKFNYDFDIGKRLPSLFYKVGLKDIEAFSCNVTLVSGDEEKKSLTKYELENFRKHIVPDYLSLKEYERLEKLNSLGKKPPLGSVVATPFFIVKGEKY